MAASFRPSFSNGDAMPHLLMLMAFLLLAMLATCAL